MVFTILFSVCLISYVIPSPGSLRRIEAAPEFGSRLVFALQVGGGDVGEFLGC